MTNEEAAQIVEVAFCVPLAVRRIGENRTYYKDEIREAKNMAIKALEKQMPQTPTIENGFVKCPKCKMYIRFPIADKYNNCPECGQAIKWAENEE